MNVNKYKKVVHAIIWFDNKVMLSKVIKDCYHKGYWSDAGGKVNQGESIIKAVRREVEEETSLYFNLEDFELIDCYIWDKRNIKAFVYEAKLLYKDSFCMVKNTEPSKQSDWQLFTVKEALKLKLMPSVKAYLKTKQQFYENNVM